MTDSNLSSSQLRGIALTDEEVIALGSRSGVPWPSPVPTVDVTDPGEVGRSASRGARSLMVRGLLGRDQDDVLSPHLEAILQPVLRGELSVGTYLVDSALVYSPDGPATAGYSDGNETERWTAEMISPSGIHYLQEESSSGCLGAARNFLETCYAAGLEMLNKTGGQVNWAYICILRRLEGETRVVAVREGEVALLDMGSGSGTEWAPRLNPLESLSEACRFLDLQ